MAVVIGANTSMKPPETIEEELEIISQALEAGIDPFPPKKPLPDGPRQHLDGSWWL